MDEDQNDQDTRSRRDVSPDDAVPDTHALGTLYKVLGELDAADGTGVRGYNKATTGASYGVEGITSAASDGNRKPAGVYGHTNSATGTTYGVLGETGSETDTAAGVRGVGTDRSGTADGVRGEVRTVDSSGTAFGAVGWRDFNTASEAGGTGFDYVGAYGKATTTSRSGQAWGVAGETDSDDGIGVAGYANSSTGENYGVVGQTQSESGFGVFSVGDVKARGDLVATGTKPFVETVTTDDGEREIVYTAVEAASVHTEVSGVGELNDGRAEVSLPGHFDRVTDSDEQLVVQTTPYGGSAGLKVVDRSTRRVVFEDLDGSGNYEFAYTVRGIRDGYSDRQVVRDDPSGGPSRDLDTTGDG